MARIYLSSTSEDVREHTAAVHKALVTVGHEVLVADRLGAADVYVGIVGQRYSDVPEENNPDRLSQPELEYREARRLGLPCLIFLSRPGPELDGKIAGFRDELRHGGTAGMFGTPDELAQKVLRAIASLELGEFDFYISYHSEDRPAARALAEQLQRLGMRVWIDVLSLRAGDDWRREGDAALRRSRALLVLVGPHGVGELQMQEVSLALARREREGESFRLIPVLLKGARPDLVPEALRPFQWVNDADLPHALTDQPSPAPAPSTEPPDLEILPALLFRLVARLRERPEMLQSPDPAAFWAAVRKVRPGAHTLDDLKSLADELSGERAPGALWTAWLRHARATELAALLQHPEMPA